MSRKIFIPLAIESEATLCGSCKNRKGGHCNVFHVQLTKKDKSYERLKECLSAEVADSLGVPFSKPVAVGRHAQLFVEKATVVHNHLQEMLAIVVEAVGMFGIDEASTTTSLNELCTKYDEKRTLVVTLFKEARHYNALRWRAIDLLKKLPTLNLVGVDVDYELAISNIIEELDRGDS